METRGTLADCERAEGKLTVWTSTQVPELVRMQIADALDFPAQNLRVVAPHVGGGFGLKVAGFPEDVVIPFLSLQLGRPVRWIEDRRENLTGALHAKQQVIDVEAALDSDGTIIALRATCNGDSGAYSCVATSALIEPWYAASMMPGVFACATTRHASWRR